jgi:hypothetical protein
MWRLVRHPDESLCVGLKDEENITIIEMEERYPPVNTLPLRILTILEVGVAMVSNEPVLYIHCLQSIMTIIVMDFNGPILCAVGIHYLFMLCVLPFITNILTVWILMCVHILTYFGVIMSRYFLN